MNKEYDNQKEVQKKKYSSFFDIRKEVIISNSDLTEENKYLEEIPYNTRQLAVKAATNTRKTCLSHIKAKLITHFKMSFKSRKDVNQICYFDASSLSLSKKGELQFCKTGFLKGNSVLQLSRRGKKDIEHYFKGERSDYSIVLEGNSYYLCLSTTVKREVNPILNEKQSVISLDPGIRSFMTGYCPEGHVLATSDVVLNKLKSEFDKVDSLVSAMTKSKGRKKKNMRVRKLKIFKKVKDVVNNMHIHVSRELARGYDTVILPEFGTSKMLSEKTLCSSTKRMMGALSFYKFKCRLTNECSKYKTDLKIVTEEYTSKTCTCCGNLHNKLGSNKIYNCIKCNLSIDRDINGARNILLKHL